MKRGVCGDEDLLVKPGTCTTPRDTIVPRDEESFEVWIDRLRELVRARAAGATSLQGGFK